MSPPDGSTVNYTHVLFEWEQEPDTDSYTFELASDAPFSNILISSDSPSLIHIEKIAVMWETTYYWRIKTDSGEIIDMFSFTTSSPKSTAEVTIYNGNLTADGVTLYGAFYDYYSVVLDKSGSEIWNSENEHFIYYNTDYYGNLYGAKLVNNPDGNNYMGVQFDLDNSIIWEEPNEEFIHHDMIPLPSGNFLGISEESEIGPVPIGDWTSICIQFFGADLCNGVNEFFPWIGDKLVEWDRETKEVVWSWAVFDHFSMEDYDTENGTWFDAFNSSPMEYDWTHMNAIIFDEEESAIYASIRHLSRIVKIAYPSGEIIWSFGMDMPSGDVNFGHDLGFNFQHSLQLLENGNMVTFDNGNSSGKSRALEIGITDLDSLYAEIKWEYELPSELFGAFSGNVQKLDNGNYLMTTVGDAGTTREVTSVNELVWEVKYNLSQPLGAVYRANRISGLHPVAFSVTVPELTEINSEPAVYVPIGENSVSFVLYNDGDSEETFEVTFTGDGDWFDSGSETVTLIPGESSTVTFSGSVTDDSSPHEVNLTAVPVHRYDMEKAVAVNAYSYEMGVDGEEPLISDFVLGIPYPNPFNSTISFDVHVPFSDAVELSIFDITGREAATIFSGELSPGRHNFSWNGIGNPSGIYFVRMESSHDNHTRKILYIK